MKGFNWVIEKVQLRTKAVEAEKAIATHIHDRVTLDMTNRELRKLSTLSTLLLQFKYGELRNESDVN